MEAKRKISKAQIEEIKALYNTNKGFLDEVEKEFEDCGILQSGCQDISETFEQGYNNALENVFSILGIEY